MDTHTTIITVKNKFGWNCHIFELRRNVKVIYRFCNEIPDDGSEIQAGIDHFYEKAEKILDDNRVNSDK